MPPLRRTTYSPKKYISEHNLKQNYNVVGIWEVSSRQTGRPWGEINDWSGRLWNLRSLKHLHKGFDYLVQSQHQAELFFVYKTFITTLQPNSYYITVRILCQYWFCLVWWWFSRSGRRVYIYIFCCWSDNSMPYVSH